MNKKDKMYLIVSMVMGKENQSLSEHRSPVSAERERTL